MENKKETYDLSELTAKNTDYIHSIKHQLSLAGQSDEEINQIITDIIPEIIEAQKEGTTARNLLGAPTAFAATYEKKKESKKAETNKDPYLMTLDSFLIIFAFLAGLNGVLVFLGSSKTSYGIVTLLLSSIVGGIALYQVYHLQVRNIELSRVANLTRRQRLFPGFLTIIYVLAWFGVTVLSIMIPRIVNPQIPPLYLIVVALLVGVFRFWLKRHFNIQSAMASPRTEPARQPAKKASKK